MKITNFDLVEVAGTLLGCRGIGFDDIDMSAFSWACESAIKGPSLAEMIWALNDRVDDFVCDAAKRDCAHRALHMGFMIANTALKVEHARAAEGLEPV